jgi:hypothetical protein
LEGKIILEETGNVPTILPDKTDHNLDKNMNTITLGKNMYM